MNLRSLTLKSVLLLVLIIGLAYLPFVLNSSTLLQRNNDLVEFIPMFQFFKTQVVSGHIPLWQNRILSGSPFLGDPQYPGLYAPNYLIMLMPETTFFLLSFFGHMLLAGLGAYLLARKYSFSNLSAIIAAIIYALSPVFVGHLEQGHLNMLAAFAWFPLFIVGLTDLIQKPRLIGSLLVGFAGAAIFINYLTIFIYAVITGGLWLLVNRKPKPFVKFLKFMVLAIFITIVLTLPQLIVAISFFPLITRNLIILEDIGPVFLSTRLFLKSIVFPYQYGLDHLGGETILHFGHLPLLLSGVAWLLAKPKYRLLILIGVGISLLFALGPKTILYQQLLQFPGLLSLRITTRFWFICVLLISFASGHVVNKLRLRPAISGVILVLVTLELIIFGRNYFASKHDWLVQPLPDNSKYNAMLQGDDYYRLYCLTRCATEIYQPNKGFVNGYNPIQLRNYYDYFQLAAGYRFGSYAVSLPPYQTYIDQPQPDSRRMGLLGVRYVVSPYSFSDSGFKLIQTQPTYIYQNTQELPQVYWKNDQITAIKPLQIYPGYYKIPTDGKTGKIVISDIYMPFWQATDAENRPVKLEAEQDIVISVEVESPTSFVVVRFGPPWLSNLVKITLCLWVLTCIFLLKQLFR